MTEPQSETDQSHIDQSQTDQSQSDQSQSDQAPTDQVVPEPTDDPVVEPSGTDPVDETEGEPEEEPDYSNVPGAIEAILLMADEPVSEITLAQAIDAPVSVVDEALSGLVAFYRETGRGFELRAVGGGWRYYTREEHADLIAAYVLEGQQSRLSQASLETLAVVAYQQPISRARISAIRGVNVDGVMRTLLARGMVEEIGHDHETGSVVFGTTSYFLERMGLRSLAELPPLAPHLPEVDELEAELSLLAAAPPLVAEPERAEPADRAEPDDEDGSAGDTGPAQTGHVQSDEHAQEPDQAQDPDQAQEPDQAQNTVPSGEPTKEDDDE